jgi:hypothetical protein
MRDRGSPVSVGVATAKAFDHTAAALATIADVAPVTYRFRRDGITEADLSPLDSPPPAEAICEVAKGYGQIMVVAMAESAVSLEVWANDPVLGWVRVGAFADVSPYHEAGPVATRWRPVFVRVTAGVPTDIAVGIL